MTPRRCHRRLREGKVVTNRKHEGSARDGRAESPDHDKLRERHEGRQFLADPVDFVFDEPHWEKGRGHPQRFVEGSQTARRHVRASRGTRVQALGESLLGEYR